MGAALLAALRARGVRVEAAGLAGPALREAGVLAAAPMESVAVMGFAEVIRHLPAIRRARAAVLALLEQDPEAIFLPIDSPGLNLGLARAAHRMGRRVVYYVLPQVWAWGYGRVRRIREDVDLMLLLFRFEEAIAAREGIAARWVGHPAGALAPPPAARRDARSALGIEDDATLIALLPGSRVGEVRRHLAPMLDAAARLAGAWEKPVRVAVSDAGPVAGTAARGDAAPLWNAVRPLRVAGTSAPLLAAADLALVASGTATLEAAVIGAPFVIVYRTGRLNYEIARRLVRLPRVGLANIVVGADAAPECIQDRATGIEIARAAAPLLVESARREAQRAAFAPLPELLGGGGSADRAAEALIEFVERGKVPAAAGAARE
ncbi:MAG TPA: lipid-A-disaccharide synthase, partial [Candidatus Eisenbacteria bacterium]|nr:lipid-A-disaccharide synthase [Candidatus Eisenbacteria bacterium]